MFHCLVQILDGVGMEDGHAGGKRSLSPAVAIQRSGWRYAQSRLFPLAAFPALASMMRGPLKGAGFFSGA